MKIPIQRIRAKMATPLWFALNPVYDAIRLAKHCLMFANEGNQPSHEAKLTFYYHKIEKALSLANPEPGFGEAWMATTFIPSVLSYHRKYGASRMLSICCKNLRAYRAFHEMKGYSLGSLADAIEHVLGVADSGARGDEGGAKTVSAADIYDACRIDFGSFVTTRHSVRVFADAPVAREEVEQAVKTARWAPSVCNRQGWHVYAADAPDDIARLLRHQNGNRSFSDSIQMLLVVAGDLRAMMNSTERHQIYFDGGLFGMSLVYSLHAQGLGTCCLNLCLNASQEMRLRKEIQMAAEHTPLMMVAVGHLLPEFKVAASPRKLVDQLLTWV